MGRLEELTAGACVLGVIAGRPVTVVAAVWHGTSAISLTYRNGDGQVAERLLFRDDEPHLSVVGASRPWSFDADGRLFRLASEARRIRLAHLFDPMLAVHLSVLEPLPHQIEAVYGDMLERHPLRFLLADDPGAGKTIMAGLFIKELALRGDLERCLIVAPGGLVAQWQDELVDKFGLGFDLLTRDAVESSQSGNPFVDRPLSIARLDHLSRNDELADKVAAVDWDLIVVDEAHRMAAHWFGGEVKKTRRYLLGERLGGCTRHLLLMTATPHNGKEEDFQLFMGLLDADRFEGRFREGVHTADVADLMRRRIKEKLLRFDGRRLFPERRASTVAYQLTPAEAGLYEAVTTYVVEEMNRADRLGAEGQGRRGNRVGFALTVLQRRLASSPEAIFQSLRRRRLRLEDRLVEEKAAKRGAEVRAANPRLARLLDDLDRDREDEAGFGGGGFDAADELADDELEQVEQEVVDAATAARTVAELEAEIATLGRLESLADRVRRSGEDRKWAELRRLVEDDPSLRGPDGARRKLIVFTEHRDTLTYLVERLRALLGRAEAVAAIHGGTLREERRRVQEVFTSDAGCLVLVATDAAGEGLNLQRAHLLVNYDLPWNPNRIEQRFGRVHRIGQTEVCHLWNLVAAETREGQVYLRLLEKLDQQRASLGGQVFDVLGQAFEGRPLRDLLLEAVRYGDDPERRAELDRVIDERVGAGLAELVEHQALAPDLLGPADVEKVRLRMEEAEARRLQPRYVGPFFKEAFRALGGRLVEREPGRFEVTHVPGEVRSRDRQIGRAALVLPAYERVCFDKALLRPEGAPPAQLVCPCHPLLDAVADLTSERHGSLLRQGAVLVDETDPGTTPWVLVYLEHAIADASGRTVSKRFEFLALAPDGTFRAAGPAPYLDCRPAAADDLAVLGPVFDAPWLAEDVEQRALDAAIALAVPEHLAVVRARVMGRVDRARRAVEVRLTREVQHWDAQAVRLSELAATGRTGAAANAAKAVKRADELSRRLKARLAALAEEAQLRPLPPVVVGGALVVPAGLLASLRPDSPARADHARHTAEVDRRAVAAVLVAERSLGREPTEMAHNNPGYDIGSTTADGHLLFIEVKGRIEGSATVTVTRNEVVFAQNAGDGHALALVEVGLDGTDTVRYLRHAFDAVGELPFDVTSVTLDWSRTWAKGADPA